MMILRRFLSLTLLCRSVMALASCAFPKALIQELQTFNCTSDNLDLCARFYRKIVQTRLQGAWGVFIVDDLTAVSREEIEWHIERVGPKASAHCRLIVPHNQWLLEIFRTGYRPQDINLNQRQWIRKQARSLGVESDAFDRCPHSLLRMLLANYRLLNDNERRTDGGVRHSVHHEVSRLAEFLAKETSRRWNVMVEKRDNNEQAHIGLNVPHYVGDGRAGFCIGETADGFRVNAMLVGFDSKEAEILANG